MSESLCKQSPLAYVVNRVNNTVSVIDTDSNTVMGPPIPVGIEPVGLAFTPDGCRVYVTNTGGNTVSVIDTKHNMVILTIPVGKGPSGIAITPDGCRAYVANRFENTVSVINLETNTVIDTIPVGNAPEGQPGPAGVAVTPFGRRVYVTHVSDGAVYVISTATNTLIDSPIPVGMGPMGIGITPDSHRAYVGNSLDGTVSVICIPTNTVIGSPITVGNGPFAIGITPDGSQVYVTNSGDGTLSVIWPANNGLVTSIPVGSSPVGIAFTPDGSRAYVTLFDSGSVITISTKTNSVIGSPIQVGNGSWRLAISMVKGEEINHCIQYTALGDSIAFGIGATNNYGYVNYFREFLEKLHDCVNLTNRAVPGFSSSSVLQQLIQDPVTREFVKNANVITLSVGGVNLLNCMGNGTNINDKCASNGVSTFNQDWPLILNVIRNSIGSKARIFAMSVYNPLIGIMPDYEKIDNYIQQINYTINRVEYRCRYNYQVVDAHKRFQGQFRDGSWKVCTWTHFCEPVSDPHPTNSGHDEIARLHKAKYCLHPH